MDLVYVQRMRTLEDRQAVRNCFEQIFHEPARCDQNPFVQITDQTLQIGYSWLKRNSRTNNDQSGIFRVRKVFLKLFLRGVLIFQLRGTSFRF